MTSFMSYIINVYKYSKIDDEHGEKRERNVKCSYTKDDIIVLNLYFKQKV